MNNTNEIIFENLAGIGLITLNRPKALNAINVAMLKTLGQQLKVWETDPTVKAVVIKSNSEKAFCAGGDIKEIYQFKQQTGKPLTEFFWHEYRLNYYIAKYPKPYIALMDGITMGGGAGISVHGRYRVATERTLFAMPETSIGLYPDIGGSYFLSRLYGEIGTYLALTGARIQAGDTQYLSLTDCYIDSSKLNELITALCVNSDIDYTLKQFNITAPSSSLSKQVHLINECFKFNSVEEIINALNNHENSWCKETAKLLLSKSPTSLTITLEQLRRGAKLDLGECLKMEYRITNHVLLAHDFYEGVRALIIDKDNQPKWQPEQLAQIGRTDVEAYFAPLPGLPDLDLN